MKFNVDDLIAKGLVHKKTYKDGPYAGLSVFKYKNNVFWDNLWHLDSRLLECRGIVVDSDDNIVIHPFTKVFNHLENGTDADPESLVGVVEKINGFMAAAASYKDSLLVSTTGTLDSDFADLAERVIRESCHDIDVFRLFLANTGATVMFEICDETDPHVVYEEPGAYMIGMRMQNVGGKEIMVSESNLDFIADIYGFKRPKVISNGMKFKDAVDLVKKCTGEGFMIRGGYYPFDTLMKIKSPHYLAKKFLMRGGNNKWDMVWENPSEAKKRVDEEFYDLLDYIRNNFSQLTWSVMSSTNRRRLLEGYFNARLA